MVPSAVDLNSKATEKPHPPGQGFRIHRFDVDQLSHYFKKVQGAVSLPKRKTYNQNRTAGRRIQAVNHTGGCMSRIFDVSMEVFPGMLVWPGDGGVELYRTQRLEAGGHNNSSRIVCGVHTGTHVDAPRHFFPGGKTIEQLPLEILSGPAWTADFSSVPRIGREALELAGIPAGTIRLLLKTGNSRLLASTPVFHEDYAGLDESGAQWVVERGIRLVGSDYLSVACRDQTGPVHRLLLGAEVILVEGLLLQDVPDGACRFTCLPVKLKGSDGAMARAMVEVD
jgi:arylformamidase